MGQHSPISIPLAPIATPSLSLQPHFHPISFFPAPSLPYLLLSSPFPTPSVFFPALAPSRPPALSLLPHPQPHLFFSCPIATPSLSLLPHRYPISDSLALFPPHLFFSNPISTPSSFSPTPSPGSALFFLPHPFPYNPISHPHLQSHLRKRQTKEQKIRLGRFFTHAQFA